LTEPRYPRVTVFGSATIVEGSAEYEQARRLGALLAGAGHTVINGGQMGTMDGVARGCREAGGRCIGITVRGAPWGSPTSHADEIRELDDLHDRTRDLLLEADAWLALPGQIGTLAEVALGWALIGGRLLEPRPLILIGEPWRRAIPALAEHLAIRPALVRHLTLVNTPEEAVACLR